MKTFATLTATAAIALPLLSPATADAAYVDTMNAGFVGTVGGNDVNNTALPGYDPGAVFVNWGDMANQDPKQQSGIAFEGVSLSGLNVYDGYSTSIGTVTFRNQTIGSGAIQQTTLRVGISGGGSTDFSTTLSWTFNVDETLNSLMPTALGGSCTGLWSASGGCGDAVTATTASISDVVSIGGQDFQVDIAGFMAPGGVDPVETFLLYEDSVKSAELMITFSEIVNGNGGGDGGGPGGGGVKPVPVPAALPLFLSALGGLGAFGYRRRNKA